MLMGDMLTLKQANLPVKVVVFSNGTLGFVEIEMKASGFLDFGCGLDNPNFAEMAESAGILGRRVEKPEELRPALETAFAQHIWVPRWWRCLYTGRSFLCLRLLPLCKPKASRGIWSRPFSAVAETKYWI